MKDGMTSSKTRPAWFTMLGPGLITAALVFGPSKMTITSKLGALYSTDLLWIVVVAMVFMIVFTQIAAAIGNSSDLSVLQLISQKWGKLTGGLLGIGVFLVCSSFQAGNAVGLGVALSELTGYQPEPFIIVFTLLSIGLLFFKSFYAMLERVMIALILIMVISFVLTLIWAPPSLKSITTGFRFSVPPGSTPLIIAFIASSFSIVGALYQSYLVQERRRVRPISAGAASGATPGIVLLGLMSGITMLASATILHPAKINPQSASDMGKALEPLFGAKASAVFLIGLFGAAFSSLVGNATVGGSLLADGLGWGAQLNTNRNRYLIALVMVIGAFIAVTFGKLPLELIVFAQRITIFVVPFLAIALFLLGNDSAIMGKKKTGLASNTIAVAGIILIVLLAALNLKYWLFTPQS